jgi:hypothetical protein
MLKSDAIRTQEQLEHLAQVQGLLQAVAAAISAIEKNDLKQFETQLAIQETICNRLSGNKWISSPATPGKALPGENPNAQLAQRIRQAYVALAQLNRAYTELVKRARRSVGLIAALYSSQGEGYNQAPSPSTHRHTWSCEV